MEKIASFKIDHTRLLRGIYVSRKDYLQGGDVVTTFDIRMKLPNREPAISQSAIHTLEHLAATWLRNHPQWGDKVVYWGPMGCCTGNYLLLRGDLESRDIVPLMQELFQWIADCGNYMLNNLPMAKWEARKYYMEVLQDIKEENLIYPEE